MSNSVILPTVGFASRLSAHSHSHNAYSTQVLVIGSSKIDFSKQLHSLDLFNESFTFTHFNQCVKFNGFLIIRLCPALGLDRRIQIVLCRETTQEDPDSPVFVATMQSCVQPQDCI